MGLYTAGANAFVMDVNAGLIRAFSTGGTTASSSAGYTANTWNLASCSFISSSSVAVYLNGTNKGTASSVGTNTATQTAIGYKSSSSTIWFGGSLAFGAVWSSTLSDTDHATLALKVHPSLIQPGNLLACIDFFGNSPESDLVSTTGWTLTGSPTESVNPLIYYR